MDGNTPNGQRPVVVSFTEDEARQILRSVQWEKMMDSHIDNGSVVPEESMEQVAQRRAFIQQILDKLYEEIEQQLD